MANINAAILETLLNMSEGTTLDFKEEQYRLEGATDEEKGEFIKDVLAFANAWKTSDAYILIGVRENPGFRATIVGVAQHPNDASLQQLVNMKTNAPIDFAYIPTTVDGKSIGVVVIPQLQPRPRFLNRKFGRLDANQVYLRRGSSTVIADPDEIARMGAAESTLNLRPTASVQLGDPVLRKLHGDVAAVCSQVLTVPPERRDPLSKLDNAIAAFDTRETIRRHFGPSRERLDEYEKQTGLLTGLAFVVHNPGGVLIEDLQIVANVPKDEALTFTDEYPREPTLLGADIYLSSVAGIAARTIRTTIHDEPESWELRARLGKVQPNATVWSAEFWIGSTTAREVPLIARVYADNIAERTEVSLQIAIKVEHGFLRRIYDNIY